MRKPMLPAARTSNVVDLMGGAEEEPRPSAGGSSAEAKGGGAARQQGHGSGGDQGFAQTRLIQLVLPAVDANQPPLLFQAHNAINLWLGDQVADLMVATAARGAWERNMAGLRQ